MVTLSCRHCRCGHGVVDHKERNMTKRLAADDAGWQHVFGGSFACEVFFQPRKELRKGVLIFWIWVVFRTNLIFGPCVSWNLGVFLVFDGLPAVISIFKHTKCIGERVAKNGTLGSLLGIANARCMKSKWHCVGICYPFAIWITVLSHLCASHTISRFSKQPGECWILSLFY